MNAAGHPQVQALRDLYGSPPDRPNEEAPPGKRQGFEGSQTNGQGLRDKPTTFHTARASADPLLHRLDGVQTAGAG